MTFARVKAEGWDEGELLTSDQQNQLDVDHTNALDGAAGGSYSTTNDLSVNGLTMKTTGAVAVSGALNTHDINATGFINSTNDIESATDVRADVDVVAGRHVTASGNITASGNVNGSTGNFTTIVVSGGADIADGLTVGGSGLVVSGAPTDVGDLSASGTVNLSTCNVVNDVSARHGLFSGHVQCQTGLTCSSGPLSAVTLNGKLVETAGVPSDSNTTYAPAQIDFVLVPNAGTTLTADRIWTIDDTGASDGMSIEFINFSTAHSVKIMGLVDEPSGVFLQNITNVFTNLRAVRIGGSWHSRHAIKSYL